MRNVRQLRALGAVIAVAALAVPAAASAHPTVYQGEAVVDLDPDPGEYMEGTSIRYTVTNHGNTMVLRETNQLTPGDHKGVMSYASLPADRRAILTPAQELATSSGAQAHASCDVPALTSESAVLGWQGTDPFYNYVPFQKTAAGLDDQGSVSEWIADVKALTNVDLSTVSDDQLETTCLALPGATPNSFHPADTTQTTKASLAGSFVEQIEELEGELGAANAAKTAAEQQLAATRAEVARMVPQLTPLRVTMGDARVSGRSVARRGASVTVTGPPLKAVTVQLSISDAQAEKLDLSSEVLATSTVTIAANGSAQAALKPKGAAARALKKLRNNVRVTVEAVSGAASARGMLTRR